jgi:hypothetical protein
MCCLCPLLDLRLRFVPSRTWETYFSGRCLTTFGRQISPPISAICFIKSDESRFGKLVSQFSQRDISLQSNYCTILIFCCVYVPYFPAHKTYQCSDQFTDKRHSPAQWSAYIHVCVHSNQPAPSIGKMLSNKAKPRVISTYWYVVSCLNSFFFCKI